MGHSNGMIDKAHFDAALKNDERYPISAEVYYKGRPDPVTYKAMDFGKINFPVQKVTVKYASGTGKKIYIGNGDYTHKDRTKVRAK